MHDLFEADVFRPRRKVSSHKVSICLKAQVQADGVGFPADKTRVRVWQLFFIKAIDASL